MVLLQRLDDLGDQGVEDRIGWIRWVGEEYGGGVQILEIQERIYPFLLEDTPILRIPCIVEGNFIIFIIASVGSDNLEQQC